MGCFFRVPLNCYEKVFRPGLKRFDDAVVSNCGENEPPSRILHALVVRAPHTDSGCAQNARQLGSLKNIDEMENLFTGTRSDVFDGIGDLQRYVLVEFPAECDVDELSSVADGKNRFACIGRGFKECNLERRAPIGGNRHACTGQGLFFIKAGMNVVSAGEYETVKVLNEIGNGCFYPENGHRNTASLKYRPPVVLVEDV